MCLIRVHGLGDFRRLGGGKTDCMLYVCGYCLIPGYDANRELE
jgi:hypothetical protein